MLKTFLPHSGIYVNIFFILTFDHFLDFSAIQGGRGKGSLK